MACIANRNTIAAQRSIRPSLCASKHILLLLTPSTLPLWHPKKHGSDQTVLGEKYQSSHLDWVKAHVHCLLY
jgi:hypothetical protein